MHRAFGLTPSIQFLSTPLPPRVSHQFSFCLQLSKVFGRMNTPLQQHQIAD